jgi:sigma-B regulation protein RsbU (phosphoserine phosphatase)
MPSPRILIVDDEPLNADYLEQELESAGYVTLTAGNGQEALARVQSDPPDLVLLDIMMPVMDGFEALRRLKADPVTQNIPVIVISAANDVQSVAKGIQLGAEDFLPKPFEPTILHARISSSLERKRLHDIEQLYLQSLQREFDIAREIQQGFLPAQLPQVDGWELAAYFKAAREVAGDFYDAFLLPDGQLVCVIGDVCGKGVGAALFMTLFRSLIRATFTADVFGSAGGMKTLTSAERLQHVISFTSNYVAETHGEADMFATVFAALIDMQSGTLRYVNCGNEAPLLVNQGGTVTELGPTGPVVGVIPNARFVVRERAMAAGDLLLAFTDGISDAINVDNAPFGRERLVGLLHGDHAAPAALIQTIEMQLDKFVGEAEQFDDITLLVVKRSG